jgi:hypothetical protein
MSNPLHELKLIDPKRCVCVDFIRIFRKLTLQTYCSVPFIEKKTIFEAKKHSPGRFENK